MTNLKRTFCVGGARGDILVDDSPLNVASSQVLGIQAVLIPRPWNQSKLTLVETLDALTGLAQ